MNKQVIIRNFSRCAKYYDFYSDVQNECGLKLAKTFENENFLKILEPGCGTGNYTALLKKRFSFSKITAFDISPEMIEIAKKKLNNNSVDFYIKDAENPDFMEKFDLITSNAAFQWFENIKSSFEKYKKMLTEEGVFAFSVFGPDTFKELQKIISSYDENASINAVYFLPKTQIELMLHAIFDHVFIIEETIKVRYASLLDLLKTIKYTGTRGDIKSDNMWTENFLRTLQDFYIQTFGEIIATYQIFLCKASIKE